MQVEVWSDVVCPWCWIGKRRLEQALSDLAGDGAAVEVTFRSFELDPNAPRRVEGPLTQMLAKKYGVPEARARAMQEQVAGVGRGDGLDFRFEQAQTGNTFDAHRLIHFASTQGLGAALKERLMAAYFSEGRAIGDRDTLVGLAAEVGLDAAAAAEVLAGDAFADAVRADEAEAHRIGARGVPFFVFDRRFAVSGAQPVDVMRRALREALAATPVSASAGDACGEDGCEV